MSTGFEPLFPVGGLTALGLAGGAQSGGTSSALESNSYSLPLPVLTVLKCVGRLLMGLVRFFHQLSHWSSSITRPLSFSRMSATLPLPPLTDRARAKSFSGASPAHDSRSSGRFQRSASGLSPSRGFRNCSGLFCSSPQKSTVRTLTDSPPMTTASLPPTTFPTLRRLSRTSDPGWNFESVTNATHNTARWKAQLFMILHFVRYGKRATGPAPLIPGARCGTRPAR